MKQALQDQWVAALRSGEYKQGTYFLYNKTFDSYCCLGVLKKITSPYATIAKDATHLEWRVLPQSIQAILITKNDQLGNSFAEIADWIEQNIVTDENLGTKV